MPDLEFSFKMLDGSYKTISVPSHVFLYSLEDKKTGLDQCHLGLFGQIYSDSEVWNLGQSFMENFYVTYDAREPHEVKLGLSYGIPKPIPNNKGVIPSPGDSQGDASSSEINSFLIAVALFAVLSLIVGGAILCCRYYHQRS